MRTLVISDLHLGLRSGRDRLQDSGVRARLAEELKLTERLVLLGDVVELRQGPVRDALARALPVLREIGAALPDSAEIIVVAGNHDHELFAGWFHRRAAHEPPPALGTESDVTWADGEPLADVAAALSSGGARVRAAYPGVWLAPRVWATHGHYLDPHTTIPMFERLGAGAMARVTRRPTSEAASAEDYETVLSPIYAWLHAAAQNGTPARGNASAEGASARVWKQLRQGARRGGWRRWGLKVVFPLMIGAVNRAGLGPVRSDIDSAALRRAPLIALGEVIDRLGIDADHVIFGHTHRAGPLEGDDRAEWRARSGALLVNTGSWVHEPVFAGTNPSSSPYGGGFAVRIDGQTAPQLVTLL